MSAPLVRRFQRLRDMTVALLRLSSNNCTMRQSCFARIQYCVGYVTSVLCEVPFPFGTNFTFRGYFTCEHCMLVSACQMWTVSKANVFMLTETIVHKSPRFNLACSYRECNTQSLQMLVISVYMPCSRSGF